MPVAIADPRNLVQVFGTPEEIIKDGLEQCKTEPNRLEIDGCGSESQTWDGCLEDWYYEGDGPLPSSYMPHDQLTWTKKKEHFYEGPD